MDRKKRKGARVLFWILFLVYLLMLEYFLFFAEATGRVFDHSYQYNLVLFHEIRRFLTYRHTLGFRAVALNLAGNVIAFMPFGFFLPLLMHKMCFFGKTVLLGFEFSLLIEVIQLFSKVGSFDVDDILLNTAGVILGYFCFFLFHRYVKQRDQNGEDRH